MSDYKPPKDNDKYDDETRLLHSEGCAPKEQLPLSQIKREPPKEEITGGVRLPMRLPIDDVKRDKELKKVVFVERMLHFLMNKQMIIQNQYRKFNYNFACLHLTCL